MPHKRNPVLTENLTGLARLIRSTVTPAMEDVTLWHERDISHSAVERVIAPDATILMDFALHRLTGVIENLTVYPARMQKNMESLRGLVFSQAVLLALIEAGMPRNDAYRVVQSHAMQVWERGGEGDDFLASLQKDEAVLKVIRPARLEQIFDYNRYAQNIGGVIERLFKDK